jgi:hypothetical protein
MTDSHFRIDRGWAKVGYSITNLSGGSAVSIFHNDEDVHNGFLNAAIFKAIDDDFSTSLGSFHGAAYHFQGFMYDFKYSAASFDALEGTTLFDSSTSGLNECDWNQYLDHHGKCQECDETCTSGCTSG